MLNQIDLVSPVLANPSSRAILERLIMLDLPQACLVSGAVFQPVWNQHTGRPAAEGIKDYDIFYFDDRDLSAETESAIRARAAQLFRDLDAFIDIKNQARVQAWYPARFGADWPSVASVLESIGRFPVRCSCVGLRPNGDGSVTLIAPFGTEELVRGVLGPNSQCPSPASFQPKAESYRARWALLRILAA